VYRNLVVVFFLCGLWHGASWNFVVWGLFHGAFLVMERIGLARAVRRMWMPLRHVYLLLVVMIGWVFFRADTLAGAVDFLKAMAGLTGPSVSPYTIAWYLPLDVRLALVAGIVGSAPIVPALAGWRARLEQRAGAARAIFVDAAAAAALLTVFGVAILHVAARSYNPFIYFRF
jgi:alginate O-acetyltransferase complex protein AlgI